jgi:pSer/pThr/pTyr-binding forkhead associated (FHA) protein
MALLMQINDGLSGVKFSIEKQRMLIGRGDDNDISIDDDLISKEHAVLEVIMSPLDESKFEFYLQDLDSTNHTFVNGDQIRLFKLRNGDIIQIGRTNLKFVDEFNGNVDETSKLYKTWIPGVYYTKDKKKK